MRSVLLRAMAVLTVSLAFPALVLAEDEPAKNPSNYPMAGAALMAGAAAAAAAGTRKPKGKDPQQNPAYDPTGTNRGGPGGPAG